MRRATCLSLGLIALALFMREFRTRRAPEIEFIPPMIDLGQVGEQQRVLAEFMIRNNAQVPYRVVNLVASCRCTAEEVTWPQILEPGADLMVPIAYDTGRGDGPMRQRLMVLLERRGEGEPLVYAKPIDVSCRVLPELRATPQELDFGVFGPDDEARSLSVHVASPTDAVYNIEAVQVRGTKLDVEYPKTVGPLGAELRVTFDPAHIYNPGSTRGAVDLALSGGRVDSLSVPVRALVSPAYVATPDVLVFDSRSDVGSMLSLMLRGYEPFRIAEVRHPDSVFMHDQPREYARSHELAIGLSEARDGPLGELVIVLIGRSGRRGSIVVRLGRVSDRTRADHKL